MKKNLLGITIFAAIFASCEKNTTTEPKALPYSNAKLVLNEGPFGSGSGSLTAVFADSTVHEVFAVENGFPLGNILQDGLTVDSLLYLATNVSSQIHCISRGTLKHKWSTAVASPRSMAVLGQKLYVSNWTNHYLKVIDVNGGALLDSVLVHGLSGAMAAKNNTLIVALDGGFSNDHRLAIVDTDLGAVDTISVGDKPSSFVIDGDELYALCEGYSDWSGTGSTAGSIWKINLLDLTTSKLAEGSEANDHGSGLSRDSDGMFYFLNGTYESSVVKWNEGDAWPTSTHINATAYGLSIIEDTLYVHDAKDYASNGAVMIYDNNGNFIDSLAAGVIPRKTIK